MGQQVSVPEAAKRLGISIDTVRRRIRRGQMPARKQETPRGYVWIVDLPDEVAEDTNRAQEETRRLHEENRHWREIAMVLGQEVAARRREVEALLTLLDRASGQSAGPAEHGSCRSPQQDGQRLTEVHRELRP